MRKKSLNQASLWIDEHCLGLIQYGDKDSPLDLDSDEDPALDLSRLKPCSGWMKASCGKIRKTPHWGCHMRWSMMSDQRRSNEKTKRWTHGPCFGPYSHMGIHAPLGAYLIIFNFIITVIWCWDNLFGLIALINLF